MKHYRANLAGVLTGLLMTLGIAPLTGLPGYAQVTSVDEGYLLGEGDRLRLDVFNVPEYSGEFQVLADGTLNLPIVGGVSVQGMTLAQASQSISQRYLQVIRRPFVTLSLIELRPVTVAIAGEIHRPGSYSFEGQGTNLSDALQQAGGITQSANIRQIQIRRQRPAQQVEVLTVDLRQLVQAGDLGQDVLLRDGDRILIPTGSALNLEDARLIANTAFASNVTTPIQVAIVGEVNRPGPHTLTPNTAGSEDQPRIPTLTQAIQEAGGITQEADIRNIEVRRTTANGEQRTIAVNFWELLQQGDLRQDLPLQAGDTVVIPTAIALTPSELTELAAASFSADEMTVNVVGEVVRPGTITVDPNTPLNQAILTAGGFTTRARRGEVELIQLNPNGTVTRRDVEVDLSENANLESNPPLRPGDTVIVGRSGIAAFNDALTSIALPLGVVLRIFAGF